MKKQIKTRDHLMVKVINGATKAGIHKDKKKAASKASCREQYIPFCQECLLNPATKDGFCSSVCKSVAAVNSSLSLQAEERVLETSLKIKLDKLNDVLGIECDVSKNGAWVKQYYCGLHCVWYRGDRDANQVICPVGEMAIEALEIVNS